jgi:hypothetical protein
MVCTKCGMLGADVRHDSEHIKKGRRKMAAKSGEETPKTAPTVRGWGDGTRVGTAS